MLRKCFFTALLIVLAVTFSAAVAQDDAKTTLLRFAQLATDVKTVSVQLEDGSTVLSNLGPFTVSDFLTVPAERSMLITLTVAPVNGLAYIKEWAVPALSSGHHTAVVMGKAADNTLDLDFVDEDHLCVDKLATGSCIIFVNNIRGSAPLTFNADTTQILTDADYRHVVVGAVPALSYRNLIAVAPSDRQTDVFRLQRGFFEPNMVYFYSLVGNYPGTASVDYNIGVSRRAAVNSMRFLRGLTANLQLTNDDQTLFSAENIVALLEQSGLDETLADEGLSLTVFAPLDAAVLEVAPDLYQCVISNADAMKALILNHVMVGSFTAAELIAKGNLPSVAGTTHSFTLGTDGFVIDGTTQVSSSLRYPTTNGTVYLINDVLVPDGFSDEYCGSG